MSFNFGAIKLVEIQLLTKFILETKLSEIGVGFRGRVAINLT